MTRLPIVSIGMPVYNGERFIAAALESVLAQSYADFELIIADNASTDATMDICRAFAAADDRVHYHRNPANLGAAPNYNRAFALAQGRYFKWADYDDLLAVDFLKKCVDVLDRNEDIVLVYPQSRVIDEAGQPLGDYAYKAQATSPDARNRFRDFALRPDAGYQVSGLARADAVRKTSLHGSYPASDLVFLAELALYGRFCAIDETLFFPRNHPYQSTKGAQTVERSRVVFFDTANAGRILLPKWQLLSGYLNAIARAPISRRDKLYCRFQMVRWSLMPDHFRALGKDVLLAGNQVVWRGIQRLTPATG